MAETDRTAAVGRASSNYMAKPLVVRPGSGINQCQAGAEGLIGAKGASLGQCDFASFVEVQS